MMDSSKQLLIAVDGGGTGCRAAIARSDLRIIGQAEGGRANVATDFALAVENVSNAIASAARNGGIDQGDLADATAHIGLAGVTTEDEKARIAAALHFGRCTVTDDRPTAATGALGGQDGYVLAVGTGTICAASIGGAMRFVGGWGFYVSDQASGAWLGRNILDRTLQCHDGILPFSGLAKDLMARFHDDPFQIVAFSISAKPGDYGTLAPDVIKAAANNDPIAHELMLGGADYLTSALGALGMPAGARLVLSGGVGPHYRSYLPPHLTQNIANPAGSSLAGALHLASKAQTAAQNEGAA